MNVPTIEKRRIRSFVPPKKKDIYMKIDEYRPCGYICGVFSFSIFFLLGVDVFCGGQCPQMLVFQGIYVHFFEGMIMSYWMFVIRNATGSD